MLLVQDHRCSFTTCGHRAPCPVLQQRRKLGLRETVQAHCAGHAGMQTDAHPGKSMPHGCARLPHCPVRQHARSGHGTVLPRVVLIAGRPTLQSPRRSPGVYWNLEPSSTRASIRVPCPSHGPPGRLPRPTWSTFQTRFDGREVVVRHLGYFVFMQKQISTV